MKAKTLRKIMGALIVPILAMGCAKHFDHNPTNTANATSKIDEPGSHSRSGGVFSVRDETKNRLLLRDIGINCLAEDVSHLPQKLDELKAAIKGSKALAPVESGEFVLAPKAQVSGNSLFVYERDADAKGDRLVLLGDGSVQKKSASEFAALKKD